VTTPNLELTPAEHGTFIEQLERGEYNLLACRILDAHHQAIDDNPDDPDGTCAICGYAVGWRNDPIDESARFLHYTFAGKREVRQWVSAHSGPRESN
jgi:hypothetical protein